MLKKMGMLFFLVIFILTSCTSLQGNRSDTHKALCGQLKHRILMSGSTQNQRIAQVQRAELLKLDQTYRKEGCE